MYTKAAIAKHPIHPMLIGFPVALYTATVAALIIYTANGDTFWYRAAFWANLGGVVMAAVAAIPGFIDLMGLPERSRARATGYRHMACNVLALVLFAASCAALGTGLYSAHGALDAGLPLLLSVVGAASTVLAGWFGWALVQTHHVGIKPTRHTAASTATPEVVDDLDEMIMPPGTYAPPTTAPTLRH